MSLLSSTFNIHLCSLSGSIQLGNAKHKSSPGTEKRCRTVASETHSTQIGDTHTHTHSTRSRNSSANYVSMAVMRRNRFMRSIYIIYEPYDFRELATATCHLPPPLLLCLMWLKNCVIWWRNLPSNKLICLARTQPKSVLSTSESVLRHSEVFSLVCV